MWFAMCSSKSKIFVKGDDIIFSIVCSPCNFMEQLDIATRDALFIYGNLDFAGGDVTQLQL